MPIATDARVAEVWDRLASVTDPELDEPVTELRFVTAVEVDAEIASISGSACRPTGAPPTSPS